MNTDTTKRIYAMLIFRPFCQVELVLAFLNDSAGSLFLGSCPTLSPSVDLPSLFFISLLHTRSTTMPLSSVQSQNLLQIWLELCHYGLISLKYLQYINSYTSHGITQIVKGRWTLQHDKNKKCLKTN